MATKNTKRHKNRKPGSMRTVLLTGFEPFGGEASNPSEEIARRLDGTVIARHRVAGARLPCVFGEARRELARLMRRHEPALVICLGLADGRSELTPERVAINVDDARIADNAAQQPVDRPVVRGGPAAYWSTLPIKAIVAALRAQRIPAEVSQTAGTFVCNHVFYGLMHALARRRPGRAAVRGGFLHVPRAVAAGDTRPGLPLETMIEGVRIAVATAVRVRRDARVAGGRIA